MTEPNVPFTLRSAAGAPTAPPPLADSLVVVIDAQEEYGGGGRLALPDLEPSLRRLVELLAAAREHGAPIVHVLHRGAPGGLFDPDHGGRPLPEARPADGELVVEKTLPNAFAGTPLLDHVERHGRPPLVIAGYMTHMCVSSTARAALDLGLATTVVADAAATRSLPSIDDGPALGAEEVHRAALAAVADRFSIIADTATVVGR